MEITYWDFIGAGILIGMLLLSAFIVFVLGRLIKHWYLNWCLNFWTRMAFRIFRTFVLPTLPQGAKDLLLEECMPPYDGPREPAHAFDPNCSTCVREREEEEERRRKLEPFKQGKW
jgi:hypothetical protein